jgi:pyrroloquinoline quinone (PQQ) biosynthesis protein C
MNEITSNPNAIIAPEQALEEYMGEQFIDWLNSYIPQEMGEWPIMMKIKTVRPKPEKLRKVVLQIFLAQEAFLGAREGDPGFLRFALANLSESDDPQAESALEILEKRRTEEMAGHRIEKGMIKTAKRDLWMKLLLAIGLTEEEIDRADPKGPTRNYIAELSEVYSTQEWQTAVGAFAAYERAIVEEYKAVAELLKNNFSLSEKDLEILTASIAVGEQYTAVGSHVLDKVVFDREAKDLVWAGVIKQLEVRQEFLNSQEKYLSPQKRDPAGE